MRRVSAVLDGSLAKRRRVEPGDILLAINGEPVLDEIDYQALTANRHVRMLVRKPDGAEREINFIKADSTPLGIQFDDSIIGNPKTCGNNCIFCFVEQMPPGMRKSLYIKDDDWRLSLLMGNFITLTNIGEREFSRIIKRKASPLYISVHATDMALRTRILGNRNGALLMERLERLKEAGLSYHLQLVLCPGLNDGTNLEQSLRDLLALRPAALSAAVVPVGLTRYREGLSPIRPYTRNEAADVLRICDAFQQEALDLYGTRFVFPADEFISIAGARLPDAGSYEHYAQVENGVGMLRQFEEELKEAFEAFGSSAFPIPEKTVLLPCGTALEPYLKEWICQYAPPQVRAEVFPVRNEFFGETVTVTGLICARDLVNQLTGISADEVLIVDTMLNSERTLFLDDMSPADVQRALGIPVRVFHNTGGDFFLALTSADPSTTETENE